MAGFLLLTKASVPVALAVDQGPLVAVRGRHGGYRSPFNLDKVQT